MKRFLNNTFGVKPLAKVPTGQNCGCCQVPYLLPLFNDKVFVIQRSEGERQNNQNCETEKVI